MNFKIMASTYMKVPHKIAELHGRLSKNIRQGGDFVAAEHVAFRLMLELNDAEKEWQISRISKE
jgi:hypothetical protein